MERCRRTLIGGSGRLLTTATAWALVAVAAVCSSSSAAGTTTVATGADQAAVANGAAPSRTDAAGVEWLCRPGLPDDPCTADLTTTVIPESGRATLAPASPAANPSVDCFYVYPTVSEQSGVVANLHVDPSETAVARIQASRFSQVCKVYAPVYPQLTLAHADRSPERSPVGTSLPSMRLFRRPGWTTWPITTEAGA